MIPSRPFDFDDADIVLRTPRSKGFRVHRNTLSVASPILRDLVADAPEASLDDDDRDLPEINVDDAPEDLDLMLRLIYPITPPPKFEDFQELTNAFDILQRYKVQGAQGLLRQILVSPPFLDSDPVRVYALACRLGFKEEAEMAAPLAATTDFTARVRPEDLSKMSGVDYHRLVVISKERMKKSRSDIFSFPLQCNDCPLSFYDQFRKKLADKLVTDDWGKFYDHMGCMEMCLTISKDCGSHDCNGAGGNLHFEKSMFALVKELQKLPARVG